MARQYKNGIWYSILQNGYFLLSTSFFLLGDFASNFLFPLGEKYQGQWGNDMQEGMGVHSWKTGEFFEGSYAHGRCVEVKTVNKLLFVVSVGVVMIIFVSIIS